MAVLFYSTRNGRMNQPMEEEKTSGSWFSYEESEVVRLSSGRGEERGRLEVSRAGTLDLGPPRVHPKVSPGTKWLSSEAAFAAA